MYDEPQCYPGGGAINQLADCAAKEDSTVRAQLERKKNNLTRQISEVTAALEALDANPEIERVLTLVGRTVRF